MSSHREAPEISKDPVADNTDVYAFVSPDDSTMVTLITNYIPLEWPAGGPNFYEFGEDVLYEIHVDNDGDAVADITYQFRFQTQVRNPKTFLYNIGPISSLDDPNWNRRQFYALTKIERRLQRTHDGQQGQGDETTHEAPQGIDDARATSLGAGLLCPPCNIGPRSTPHYPDLAAMAVHSLPSGETVFAGQRAEGFYVDLGAVFDLGDLRPFQSLHLIPSADAPGVNGTANLNVHSIAIKVPKTHLTRDGSSPTDPAAAGSVIGVWASASRQRVRVRHHNEGEGADFGGWMQVSRLGNPLFNEVIVPMGDKDYWNTLRPQDDAQFLEYVQHPELAHLIPILYPTPFPNLRALDAGGKQRADLVAILLTGLPTGIITGFQNFTGPTYADMLRLNMAIPPAGTPDVLGILGGDLAGFPNGRRVFDDVFTIELRALAGLTYPLVDKTYTPDGAASLVRDFIKPNGGPPSQLTPAPIPPEGSYLSTFPYLGVAYDGYSHPSMPTS